MNACNACRASGCVERANIFVPNHGCPIPWAQDPKPDAPRPRIHLGAGFLGVATELAEKLGVLAEQQVALRKNRN